MKECRDKVQTQPQSVPNRKKKTDAYNVNYQALIL